MALYEIQGNTLYYGNAATDGFRFVKNLVVADGQGNFHEAQLGYYDPGYDNSSTGDFAPGSFLVYLDNTNIYKIVTATIPNDGGIWEISGSALPGAEIYISQMPENYIINESEFPLIDLENYKVKNSKTGIILKAIANDKGTYTFSNVEKLRSGSIIIWYITSSYYMQTGALTVNVQAALGNIDLQGYFIYKTRLTEQLACPTCAVTYPCPVCGGEGTIDGSVCAVCQGVGTLTKKTGITDTGVGCRDCRGTGLPSLYQNRYQYFIGGESPIELGDPETTRMHTVQLSILPENCTCPDCGGLGTIDSGETMDCPRCAPTAAISTFNLARSTEYVECPECGEILYNEEEGYCDNYDCVNNPTYGSCPDCGNLIEECTCEEGEIIELQIGQNYITYGNTYNFIVQHDAPVTLFIKHIYYGEEESHTEFYYEYHIDEYVNLMVNDQCMTARIQQFEGLTLGDTVSIYLQECDSDESYHGYVYISNSEEEPICEECGNSWENCICTGGNEDICEGCGNPLSECICDEDNEEDFCPECGVDLTIEDHSPDCSYYEGGGAGNGNCPNCYNANLDSDGWCAACGYVQSTCKLCNGTKKIPVPKVCPTCNGTGTLLTTPNAEQLDHLAKYKITESNHSTNPQYHENGCLQTSLSSFEVCSGCNSQLSSSGKCPNVDNEESPCTGNYPTKRKYLFPWDKQYKAPRNNTNIDERIIVWTYADNEDDILTIDRAEPGNANRIVSRNTGWGWCDNCENLESECTCCPNCEGTNFDGYYCPDCEYTSEPEEDDGYCPDCGNLWEDCTCEGEDDCLAAETLITMADGTQKPITDIQRGELVLDKFGKPSIVHFVGNHLKRAYHTYYYFDDGTVIHEVYKHRFYNATQGFYQLMRNWNIGDEAIKIDGSRTALVSKETIHEPIEKYSIYSSHGTYYANGLLSGQAFCNTEFLSEMSASKAIDMLLSVGSEKSIFNLFKEKGALIT